MDLTQDVVKALLVHVLGFKAVGCLFALLAVFFLHAKRKPQKCA